MMENWAVDFLGVAEKKGILVNRNGDYGPPKALQLDPDWTFVDFLHAASNRLDLIPTASRAFNANGVEIDDCMMVVDDDRMFLSQGEPFASRKPYRESNENKETANSQQVEAVITEVGPYTIGEYLGRGGFGEVRVGINQLSGEKVALKFLRKCDICTVKAAERTGTEIQCLSSLNHPNIIRLFVRLETHKHVVLAFDLMQGDVFKYMVKRGTTAAECALTESQAKALFHQVLSGVEYIHKNLIIHSDLKLENLLLKDNTLETVKIADFGLSQFFRPGVHLRCDGSGTISTSAPELFVRNATYKSETYNLGPPLDVWSLGVVLFALLNGRLPFDGPTFLGPQLSEQTVKADIMSCKYNIDNRVSFDGKDLIRALLAKEPSDRPSIADIFDHRWLRSRYSGDSKELSSTSKSGANITFRNFEEYCGRGKFPETDTWKIDSALEIERRNKSVNLSTDNNSTATTHSAGTSASTSSSTRIDYQITRRKSLSADGEKDKAKDRERERNRERERDRDRSGASPSQAALSLKRRDKGMGGSQALPSFRRHRNDVSPSGARRAGRQDRESVSERSIGTIKILPDLTSSSFSDKDVSSKQAKAKRGSKQLIPIPSDLVRGRDRDPSDRDRDRERETSRHSADLKDHHRIHLRPI